MADDSSGALETRVGRGISLWLTPAEGQGERWVQAIGHFAGRFAGPVFAPHVTLLAAIGGPQEVVVATAGRLASAVRPLRLDLGQPQATDEYFRALVLPVKPDEALSQAHVLARTAFADSSARPFWPHLSLLYAELDQGIREGIVREVGESLAGIVEVTTLVAMLTEGPAEAWRRLASFDLRWPLG